MNSTPGNSPPETIVAISTPPGRGGLGVVRLSGSEAVRIAGSMLRLTHPLAPGQARFGDLVDPSTGEKLDEVVSTWFQAPRSYTGQDVVEISAHGSPVVLEAILAHALEAGAILARPGEFTECAFLNGRMDLMQAEAVRDLIEAQTLYQAKVAVRQMGGALSRRIQPAKRTLVDLIAQLEAGIDFAEDDIDVMPAEEIITRIVARERELATIADSFSRGRIVNSGLNLAIVGRANAGKSSLFNRLVERERAIVTAAPGTTRDLVTERISLGGVPVELVDTAGLRGLSEEVCDEAERIGIVRSREALADADLILLVMDAAAKRVPEEDELLATISGRQAIVVLNKIDLPRQGALPSTGMEQIATSALTGEGIAQLRARIAEMVQGGAGETEDGIVTNLRQAQAIREALDSLAAARRAAAQSIPHEMILLDLYAALHALDSLTGGTTTEDILTRIFSTFCIGK